jgi:hypothetical protein
MWFGVVTNSSSLNNNATTRERWTHEMVPHAIQCKHQKAKYKVQSLWNGDKLAWRNATVSEGVSLFEEWGIDHLSPLDNMERYKEFTAYYAVGYELREFIRGTMVKVLNTTPTVWARKLTGN